MASTTIPKTMRALLQPSKLSADVVLSDVPVPTPSPNEYLIKVHTTALTNNELHWARLFPSIPISPTKLPIPCFDMCGTIVTSPSSTSKFSPGDEVWGRTNFYYAGSAAEYTVAPESEIALRTKALSWEESATVPMSAVTAWQALFVQTGSVLKAEAGTGAKGKRVFITAASGAVGRWMVQLAKWAGADVVGTASGAAMEVVKSLGAGEVLDYRSADVKAWATEEKKADVVIDCIGGKSLQDSWWVVKKNGVLISVNDVPEGKKPEGVEEGIKSLFFVMEANGEQLEKITKLIDAGGFVGSLDSTWKLEDGPKAVEKLESGKAKGKIVFNLLA